MWEDKANTQQITKEGCSYKKRHRERMLCPECGRDLTKESLVSHRQTQHSVEKWKSGQEGNEEGGGNEPRTFRMAFPAKT